MPYRLIFFSITFMLGQAVQANAEVTTAVKLPSKKDFHLFLLVGQSNMAGRGKVEEQDIQSHPRVLMFTKENQWEAAVDPLHFDKPKYIGVGLGRTFGIEIAESNPKITVGLIPCAVGGSPIASWEPGALDKATNTHPYDDTLARMKIAQPAGTLKGILWHQGESDSKPGYSAAYAANLHTVISRFRKEFSDPDVPFLVGQMGIFVEQPWNAEKKLVDAAHRYLPNQVSNTAFVSAKDLHHKGDEVHFDSPSYRELGRRYAQAYIKLISTQ